MTALFSNILVDIDATAPTHPALERSLALARACGARVTIVDVLTIPAEASAHLPPGLEEEVRARRRHQLEAIARATTDLDVSAQLLAGRPATVLIQQVLRNHHDLLVRSHVRDLAAGAWRPFGAVDLELLRKCPCPVLLVGPAAPAAQRLVVGAVNAGTHDPEETELNLKIGRLTRDLAALSGGTPRLVHAWQPFAERIVRGHASGDAFQAYVEQVRQRAERDLAALAHAVGGSVDTLSRRGEPEDVIPEVVATFGVDLVVMGTVARRGVSGLLFGNTAERVLRRLPCSVLAVKPDGFVSPVTV